MKRWLVFLLLLSLCHVFVQAQTAGLIIKPATGEGAAVLDPNGDGYASELPTGYVSNDFLFSETENDFVALVRPDPVGDPTIGPTGSFNEIVGLDGTGEYAIFTYIDGNGNFLVRFRLDGYAPNSKTYALFIDTDEKFGFSGPNADEDATLDNPGFELEISLHTNFDVTIYNIDNGGSSLIGSPYSYDTHCQKSIAYSQNSSTLDYFYDFYVPLAATGISSSTPIRCVAVTTMNPNQAIGNNTLSDVGGVDDRTGDLISNFEDLIGDQTPTPPGQTVLPRSECPTIYAPISSSSTAIGGYSSEANGTIIKVFKNGNYLGQTTVTTNSWTYLNASMGLMNGDIVSATATASNEGESESSCNEEIVGAECSLAPTNVVVVQANKGVQFTVNITYPTTVYIYEYNATTSTYDIWNQQTYSTSGTYIIQGGQGQALSGGNHYVTASINGGCESSKVYFCVEHQVTVSTAPTINTTPAITTSSTSVTGTGIAGSTILLYADDTEIGSTVITSGTTWSIPVSGLLPCQVINAKQIETGECVSALSNSITVSGTASTPSIAENYCTTTSISSVSGYSAEAAGATVRIYVNGSATSSGNSTVDGNGNWTVGSLSISAGSTFVAKVTDTANCKTESAPSTTITVGTLSNNTAAISGTVYEDHVSVSGTGTDGATVKLYIDQSYIGEATVSGGWTISTIVNGMNELYAGGQLTVTTTVGSNCESLHSAPTVVQCVTPLNNQTITRDKNEYCYGESGLITLTNSQGGVIYTPVLVSNPTTIVGYSSLGNGGTITMQTNALAVNQTITVRAVKISPVPCYSVNTNSLNMVVIALPLNNMVVTPDNPTICEGSTITVGLATTESSTTTYVLADAVTDATMSNPVAGTGGSISIPSFPIYTNHNLKVIATNTVTGCTNALTDQVLITLQGPDLNVAVTVGQSVVCVSQSTSISVATQNNSNYIYTVKNSGGTVIGSFAGNGTVRSVSTGALSASQSYYVEVTDNSGAGCGTKQLATTVSVSVTQITLTPSISNISCYGQTDGEVTVSPAGGTPSYSYSWNSGEATSSIVNKSAGTYSVTVTDQNSCTASGAYTITTPASPLTIAVILVKNVNPLGASNGSIDVSASGGTPTYHYSKDGVDFSNTNGKFGSLIQGTYTLWARDANGCTATTTGTVGAPGSLLVTGIVTPVLCNGGNNGIITVTAPTGGTAPYYYSIDDGVTFQSSNIFSGLIAGTYTVKVKDSNLPISSGSGVFVVTQPQPISAIASITNVSCNTGTNGAIQLTTVSGGVAATPYLFDWNNDGTGDFNDAQNLSGLAAGNYSVTIKDNNNCTVTYAYAVTQPAAISIAGVVSDVTAAGANDGGVVTTITGGTTDYTYSWNSSPVQNGANLINVGVGTYSITVTDANNCGATAVFYVGGPVATYQGCNYNVQDNFENSYSNSSGLIPWTTNWIESYDDNNIATGWFRESNARSFSGSSGYLLEVGAQTKNQNKTSTPVLSRTLDLSNVSAIDISFNYSIVQNQNNGNGYVSINIGSVYSSSISLANGVLPTSFTQHITSGLGANSTISFSIEGNNIDNLLIIDNLQITYQKTLNLTAIPTSLSCNGNNSGAIALTVTGGHTPYTFSWDGPDPFTSSSEDISGLVAGSYALTLSDAGACAINASIYVPEPSALGVIETVTSVTCNGGSDGTISISAFGGTFPYSYAWTGPGSFSSTNKDISGLVAGTYNLTVTDFKGCTYSTSFTVNQPTPMSATVNTIGISCYGEDDGSITFSTPTGSSGTYQFSKDGGSNWEPASGTSGSYSFTGLIAATYQLRMRDFTVPACVISFTDVTLSNPTELIGSVVSSTNTTCYLVSDGTIEVSATGGSGSYQYSIDNGFSWSANGAFSGLIASTYNIKVRDTNHLSCIDDVGSVEITQPDALTATVASTNITCNGSSDGTITISNPQNGSGSYEYSVNGGIGWQASASFSGLPVGTYDVWIRDANNSSCDFLISDDLTLTEPTALSGSAIATNTLCNGSNDGTIAITASGGNGSFDFTIDGGSNWFTGVSPYTFTVAAGTYDVRIRISGVTTCTYTVNNLLVVTQPSPISILSQVANNVSCRGANDGAIAVEATGGTGVYNYTISSGGSSAAGTFFGLAPGSYTVSATDANGCTPAVTSSMIISEPAIYTVSDINVVPSNGDVCIDGTVTLSVNVAGGATPYSYQWQSSTDNVTFTNSSTSASYSPTTTAVGSTYHRVIVDEAGSCTPIQTNAVIITVHADPAISADPADESVCKDDVVTLSVGVSGGYGTSTYQWQSSINDIAFSDMSGQTAATLSPPTSSIGVMYYRVIVSNSTSGCNSVTSGSATVTVTTCSVPPTAVEDIYATQYNTALSNQPILSNDTDDGTIDASSVVLYLDNTTPTGGTSITDASGNIWSVNGSGQLTFTPFANFDGTATIYYTVNDDIALTSNRASISVTTLDIICPAGGGNIGCNPTIPTPGTPTYKTHAPWVMTSSVPGTIDNVVGCNHTYTIRYTAEWKINGTTGSKIITCDQVFTYIVDASNPTFTTSCPANQVVNANNTGCTYLQNTNGWNVVATDDCATPPSVYYTLSGATTGGGPGNTTLNGVTFNPGTTTVTWTAVDNCSKTATCDFTVTVNSISVSVALVGTEDCPELVPAQGFNPESGVYDAGATQVVFSVTLNNSDETSWRFDYNIDASEVVRTDVASPSPNPQTGNDVPVTGSNIKMMTFYINNRPGFEIKPIFNVTGVTTDNDGCVYTTTQTADVTVKAMPVVGAFN